jgi:putative SOS response-associated peptidase YedK
VCGRYVSAGDLADLAVLLGANPFAPDEAADPSDREARRAARTSSATRRYAFAPTDPVPAVLPGAQPGSRQLDLLSWGLVPPWADVRSGAGRINARVEAVVDRPSFRRAVRSRRALLPADGWYEWVRDPAGRKLPHLVRPADGGLLVFAGLYERARRPDGTSLRTCSILTGPAPAPLTWLHERAPLILPPELWAAWLDPTLDAQADVEDLLRAAADTPPPAMSTTPVSTAVNGVRNTGPGLLEPVDGPDEVADRHREQAGLW